MARIVYLCYLTIVFALTARSIDGKTCSHIGDTYDSSLSVPFFCEGNIVDPNQLIMGDFNGDSRSDWFCKINDPTSSVNDEYSLAQIGGTFFTKSKAGTDNWCDGSIGKLYAADVDGNGRDELICVYNDGSRYEISYFKGHRFSSRSQMSVSFICDYTTQELELHIGDVDGDRSDDFVCVDKSIGSIVIHYNSAHHRQKRHLSGGRNYFGQERKGYEVPFTFCMGASKTFVLGDLNGDGAKDLVCNDITTGDVDFSLSNRGHGFHRMVTKNIVFCGGNSAYTLQRFVVHDVDGDRRGDLVCLYEASGYKEDIFLTDNLLSYSATAPTSVDISSAGLYCNTYQLQMDDFNGDHAMDLACGGFLVISYSVCLP